MSDHIEIHGVDTELMDVPIVGTMPLIMHAFGAKAKQLMLDREQGRKPPKEIRSPEADYQAAFYRMKDGTPGFPVTAFKAATVGAARFYGKGVKMTELRQFMFFYGELSDADPQALVPIIGEPRMREDAVRVSSGGADLRYRPEFPEWKTTLRVRFVKTSLDASSVLSLIDAGGLGVGVGDWRPERRGDFGTYRIDPTQEVQFRRT